MRGKPCLKFARFAFADSISSLNDVFYRTDLQSLWQVV
jgi:hypothetical protein